MAKAKRSVEAAAAAAVKENKGFRAVSVMPAMKEDHPVADVTLPNGINIQVVSGQLPRISIPRLPYPGIGLPGLRPRPWPLLRGPR